MNLAQSERDEAKINFTPLVQKFIDNQDINPRSKTTYKIAVRLFIEWFEKQDVEKPTKETLLRYKNDLGRKGLRSSTRTSYLGVMRRFFDWCASEDLYPNIAFGIKGTRRNFHVHSKDALKIDEVKRLFGVINRVSLQGMRDFAIINLLVRTGLRLIEIIRADWGDLVTKENGALLWIQSKGRDEKDDYVVLTPDTLEPITDYLKERNVVLKKEPLFASVSDRNYGERLTTYSVSRLIKKYFRKADLDSSRITAHSLRHTFGVLSIKAGSSLHEVQLSMRHRSSDTTQIYLSTINNEMRMAAAPEKRLSELLNKGTE